MYLCLCVSVCLCDQILALHHRGSSARYLPACPLPAACCPPAVNPRLLTGDNTPKTYLNSPTWQRCAGIVCRPGNAVSCLAGGSSGWRIRRKVALYKVSVISI